MIYFSVLRLYNFTAV